MYRVPHHFDRFVVSIGRWIHPRCFGARAPGSAPGGGRCFSRCSFQRTFSAVTSQAICADVDGSGTLGRDEVKAMLTQRGLTATDGYVDGIFDGYDQD